VQAGHGTWGPEERGGKGGGIFDFLNKTGLLKEREKAGKGGGKMTEGVNRC